MKFTKSLTFIFLLVFLSTVQLGILADNYSDAVKAFVSKDYLLAEKILLPLAKSGHAKAQYSLGTLYEKGLGVKVDPVVSLMFYKLAESGGYQQATGLINRLQPTLTKTQLAAAEKLFMNWESATLTANVSKSPITEQIPPREVVFNGSLGKQWKELAAFGGNFKKFAQLENNMLLVDVPEGNNLGKTGIRSTEPLVQIPQENDLFANKVTFSIDPQHSSDFVLALIPSNWDGNLEWRSHHIRVSIFKDKEGKLSTLTLWLKQVNIMEIKLEPENFKEIGIVIRPDRLILVTDGEDNILLQGYISEKMVGNSKKGYRISALAMAPEKGLYAKLALRTISIAKQPYAADKIADNPNLWLDKTQKTLLFDGQIVDKHWVKYNASGGNFKKHAQLKNGALIVDVPENSGWGKVGFMSPEPLVWLDKFGEGAEVRVNFKFDPEQTTGFAIALTPYFSLNGNDPKEPRALLYWQKTNDGQSTKVSLMLHPNKKWEPLWELNLPGQMPEEAGFILTPDGIQIDAHGISKEVIPWMVVKPNQGFRVYAYSHADKDKNPVKMALKQISLERKAGQSFTIAKPADGVAPLVEKVLFDGSLGKLWETTTTANGEFAKQGRFENGRLIIDFPKKAGYSKRVGLLSNQPIIDLNERINTISYKLKVKLDPKQTDGIQIMLSNSKTPNMWKNMSAAINFVRYTKGKHAGNYVLLLRASQAPYAVWKREVDASWVENNWDGNLEIEVGVGWLTASVSELHKVRGTGLSFAKNSRKYMTIYPLAQDKYEYDGAKLVLEKITGKWLMPDGMTKMDRFTYVDDNDFDANAFLDVLAEMLDDEDKKDEFNNELNLLP